MRHSWRKTARWHDGVASWILQPPSSPTGMMPKRKQTNESDDSDKSKDKRVKKGKDGRQDSKIKKKDQKKRDKKKGKKGKSKRSKSASSSRGSAGMEEAEAAPGGGKGDGKGKDGDGDCMQASKQGRRGLQRRQRRRERWWPLRSGACREVSSLLSFSITSHRMGTWIGLTAKSSSRKSTKYQSRC